MSDQRQSIANKTEPAQLIEQRLRPHQLAEAAGTGGSWLWEGFLGAGKMTLITSQWKAGKTTLLANLLARMGPGGVLAGLPVAAARAAVVSEEGPDNWDRRCRKLNIGPHLSLFCRPFRGRPTPADWRNLVKTLLDMRRHEGLDLVAIDPLAVFLPTANENSASIMMECLLPLQDLTAAGLCVLLTHHPRKGTPSAGQAARGSGALPSHVDILMEMSWHGEPHALDRRRWLRAFSRHEETRRTLLIELTADGNDYLAHEAADHEAGAESGKVLKLVLEDATSRLTRLEILAEWPEDFSRPDPATISRSLNRGIADGRILRGGTGRRNDPYRYWLPHKEDDLFPGGGASAAELTRWSVRWQQQYLDKLTADEETDDAATEDDAPEEPEETTAEIHPLPVASQPAAPSEPARQAQTPLVPPVPEAPPADQAPTELMPYLKWREQKMQVDWRKSRRLVD